MKTGSVSRKFLSIITGHLYHLHTLRDTPKFAISQYFYWLGVFATIIGIVAIVSIDKCVAIIVVVFCFVLAFIIPFFDAFLRRDFKLKAIGKSNITFTFGDLLKEKCFVITTTIYFDVNPAGEYTSDKSLLANFVREYFPNNVNELEELINQEISKLRECNNVEPFEYGTLIKIHHSEKIIYLLAFTDRIKTNQPNDFYVKTIKQLFEKIVNENHGETIAVPLFGENNNISDSGFEDAKMSFKSLMAMINYFEIVNQRSEIKLKIVALPEKRAELIKLIQSYTK